ncbi:hypothetical protein GH810_07810 [Acetobacterium paludosum]|uniref:Uncharacterized protein n=1 Tax=Acetobacterium paludosum TaxID=52693 RepID=A0A923HV18_9FIRM|nr:hypothetical protein [Acetobacterium paludosum]MBC3888212.1 hypothetical protein [Acetobacterium paludosum]
MDNNFRRIMSFCLVFIFLSVLFLSQIFIITHINHDCQGENCPICAEIHIAEAVLQQFGFAVQTVVISIAFVCFMAESILFPNQINLINTQVKLKIRMNE